MLNLCQLQIFTKKKTLLSLLLIYSDVFKYKNNFKVTILAGKNLPWSPTVLG